ncbi:hypothetical protein F5X98DRAFT_375447 [Xylaria grammica]|nr:hypothetical protein F5X98DRAFT_375447 [Xylaria grammica]
MVDTYTQKMTRNPTESRRLDKRLDLMVENIGYLLHPSITAALPKAPAIADVATGTGGFLLRVRDLYPEGTFDGSDISPAAFPPPGDLPENVTFTVLDSATSFIVNRYADAPTRVVRKNLRLLQGKFGAVFREQASYGWDTLPTHMQEAGLHLVVRDVVSSDRISNTRGRATANRVRVFLAFARLMAERGAPGAMAIEEIDRLEMNIPNDIKSGAYLRHDIHVSCGRKSLN